MATIAQFIGSNWTEGATLPLAWQLTSGGDFSNCGTLTVQSVSEFAITFQLTANILTFDINATVEISLTNQNATETSGPVSLVLNGASAPNGGYTEVAANAPNDLPGGNAACINQININGTQITDIQIWAVGAQTAIYVDPSKWKQPSFWVLA